MTFAAGLVAGIVVTGLAGLFVFQARVIAGDKKVPRPDPWRLVAVAALVIAIIALVRSGDDGGSTSDATVPPTTPVIVGPAGSSTSTSVSTTSTTSTTLLREVTVPNVVGMTQSNAVEALTRAGLRSHVQTLPLASVPAGFVVTQAPMAFSTTTSGAIVSLGVSVKT